MKKVLLPRCGGKTTELIKESAQTGCYIVCANKKEACRISSIAKETGFNILFPLTFNEFIKKMYYGKNIKGFLIDNADILLQSLTEIPIVSITMSI
jgi:hypothetical protein